MAEYTGATTGQSSTLSAFFDNQADALAAADRLRGIGVPDSGIRLTEGGSREASAAADTQNKGFFEELSEFFFPPEDRHAYAEGLSRGGYLLTVSGASGALQDQIIDVLDDAGAVDIDEREASWRSEGWSGYSSQTGTGASATTGGDLGVASTDVDAGTRASSTDFDAGSRTLGTDETVQVVEEQLRVGRRDVNLGRVRVRSYIHEEPVREEVDLTSERVEIERRPVDRPVSSADDAFRERTIEAEERAEEAVVSKEARVVEEIGLRQTQESRRETVSDTVRRTEVEIEDERETGARTLDKTVDTELDKDRR